MRQFIWSSKPTNRERQTNLPLKTRIARTLSRLTRTNSKLTRTNSNLTRTNSKPNPIQSLCNHNKGQKEQQKLRTTNNPTEGVTIIKTHFIENIQTLDQCTTKSK